MSQNTTWIYHERQEALLCGQHALNNLLQSQSFTPYTLAEIAHQLDQMELNYMSVNNRNGNESRDYQQRIAEGSGNVDASGNFSIEVLRSALLSQFNLTLVNVMQENIRNIEITEFDGFICNRDSHWFALRKINGRFWNLNSMKENPELISHFRLAAEIDGLQKSGYSVFCVAEIGSLPTPCVDENERDERGLPQFWWREDDLIKGNAKKEACAVNDPWRNVGNGMRLDGQPTNSNTATSNGGTVSSTNVNAINIEGLTEEEMIAMALAASMEPQTPQGNDEITNIPKVELLPEPAHGTEGVVRVVFRLPDGKKIERRFLEIEPVAVLYEFMKTTTSTSATIELRAGFPPKDVYPMSHSTLKDAKLAGELIQCRYS